MNKINSPIPLNHVQLNQQNSPASARPAMFSQTLTPLTPPGGSPSAASVATSTEQPQVPPMRLALFERTFGQVQQMLTERRQAGGEESAQRPSGLTGSELRECDAVAQWVSERLMPSGSR
jgi:hypothetical protein